MSSDLVLHVADPGARVTERDDALLVTFGLGVAEHDRLARHEGEPDELSADLCRQAADATVLWVRLAVGHPVGIRAWKGLTSTYELFYHLGQDGRVILSDHFRNVLAALPVGARRVPDPAVIDHFLFRAVFCHGSYCEGIARLGHGESLTLDAATLEAKRGLFDRRESQPEDVPLKEHVDRIEAALDTTLAPLRRRDDVANQFSGGVDSTLVQTFIKGVVPPVNVVSDTPEFSLEGAYASRAAELLGETLVRPEMREADYLADLVEAIKALGMPPNHESAPLSLTACRQPYACFIVGQFAGSIFGKDGSHKSRIAWHFRSPLARTLLHAGEALAPATAARRIKALGHTAQGFGRPFGDPFGHAGRHCVYSDLPMAIALFGEAAVRARLQERIDYACERVALAASSRDPFIQQLELDQWIEIFSDQMLPDRHLANALGKEVKAPYASGPMVDAVLKVPVAKRYLDGLRAKYLLKEVLGRRLPAYPLRQRKLPTALPFARFYQSGPLASVWEHYPVPDLFEGDLRRRMLEQPNWMTWNAITFAMWRQEVFENEALAPLPTARVWRWRRAQQRQDALA